MAAGDGDAAVWASINLTTEELKPSTTNWLVENLHQEFQFLKTFIKFG